MIVHDSQIATVSHFYLLYPFLDDKDFIPCFRSTGVVKIPKKTLPVFVSHQNENLKTCRKKSWPSFSIKRASEDEIICQNELAKDFYSIQKMTPKYEVQPQRKAVKKARLNRNILIHMFRRIKLCNIS